MLIRFNGNAYWWDAVVNLMDDEIREHIHLNCDFKTEEEFLDKYCDLHFEKYEVEFSIK